VLTPVEILDGGTRVQAYLFLGLYLGLADLVKSGVGSPALRDVLAKGSNTWEGGSRAYTGCRSCLILMLL